jgi:hypothetical protein
VLHGQRDEGQMNQDEALLRNYARDPASLIKLTIEEGIRASAPKGILANEPDMPKGTAPPSGDREGRLLLMRGASRLQLAIFTLRYFDYAVDAMGRARMSMGQVAGDYGIYTDHLFAETLNDSDIAKRLRISVPMVKDETGKALLQVVSNIHVCLERIVAAMTKRDPEFARRALHAFADGFQRGRAMASRGKM